MQLWNDKTLGFPPVNTYKATNKDLDLQRLYSYCMEAKEFFHGETFMYAEYLLLSRIIYRTHMKFRTTKEMKTLKKLQKALRNYFQMDLAKDIQFYCGLIPPRYITETYLPNKNLLDYILLRLQGVVKLMERIVETSKIAASFLDCRISIGQIWKVAFILFAIVSRIYVLAKYITNCTCEYYNKLYPFSQQMKNKGASILPDGYEMCEDLRQWLNVDWLDLDDDIQILEESPELSIIKYFNLADDEDDDDDVLVSDEFVLVADPDPEEMEIINSFKRLPKINLKRKLDENRELRGFRQEDVGEVIELADETITSDRLDLDDSDRSDQNESVIESEVTDNEEPKSVTPNRKRKFSSINTLVEKGKKSAKKVKLTSEQTNEVIEVDSLSDSSVVIVDEKQNKQSESHANISSNNTTKQDRKAKKKKKHLLMSPSTSKVLKNNISPTVELNKRKEK